MHAPARYELSFHSSSPPSSPHFSQLHSCRGPARCSAGRTKCLCVSVSLSRPSLLLFHAQMDQNPPPLCTGSEKLSSKSPLRTARVRLFSPLSYPLRLSPAAFRPIAHSCPQCPPPTPPSLRTFRKIHFTSLPWAISSGVRPCGR
jgi:hypothetical protein